MDDEKDNGPATDYDLSAMTLVTMENMHDRDCVDRQLQGDKPLDLDSYHELLVLRGMEQEDVRMLMKRGINDQRIRRVTKDRFIKQN